MKIWKRKIERKAAQLSLVLGRAEGIKLKNHRGRGRLALSSQITRLSGRDYSPLILESARNEPFSLSPSIKKTGTGLRPSDATSWRGRSRMTPSSGFHGRKEGRKEGGRSGFYPRFPKIKIPSSRHSPPHPSSPPRSSSRIQRGGKNDFSARNSAATSQSRICISFRRWVGREEEYRDLLLESRG